MICAHDLVAFDRHLIFHIRIYGRDWLCKIEIGFSTWLAMYKYLPIRSQNLVEPVWDSVYQGLRFKRFIAGSSVKLWGIQIGYHSKVLRTLWGCEWTKIKVFLKELWRSKHVILGMKVHPKFDIKEPPNLAELIIPVEARCQNSKSSRRGGSSATGWNMTKCFSFASRHDASLNPFQLFELKNEWKYNKYEDYIDDDSTSTKKKYQ